MATFLTDQLSIVEKKFGNQQEKLNWTAHLRALFWECWQNSQNCGSRSLLQA